MWLRRIFLVVFGAVLLVSALGVRWEGVWSYVFGAPSPFWRWTVGGIQGLDRIVWEFGAYPTGVAIGVVGGLLAYFAPDMWAHLRRYPKNRERFEREFREEYYQKARQRFRWHL